jgi:hypothetical protein
MSLIDSFTYRVVDLHVAKSPFSLKWTGNVGATYSIGLPANLRLI